MDFTKLITRVNYTMGQLATALDWNRMGEVAARNLFNMFGWAHGARKVGTDTSLLVSGTGKSLDFIVTQVSALDIEVAPGVAMVYDSGSIGGAGDVFESDAYQAIVLDAAFPITLSTPGSYPRVDVVYAEYDTNTDTTDGRFIKSGAIASTPINTRKLWDALVSVQDGTDGSYAVPSVGGDYVELARILHTGAGAITIYDTRPILETSEALKAPPTGVLTGDYCLHDDAAGTATDSLTLSATSPASLTVLLRPGIVVQNGRSIRVPFQPLTVSTPDATHPRIDLVTFNNGTITVTAGTPAASPAVPSTPTGHVPLAIIYVDASATTVTVFDDLREVNKWLTGDEFQRDAVLDSVGLGSSLLWETTHTHRRYVAAAEILADPDTTDAPLLTFDGASQFWSVGGTSGTSSWYVPTGWLPVVGSGTPPVLATVKVYYEYATSSSSALYMTVSDVNMVTGEAGGVISRAVSVTSASAGAGTLTATINTTTATDRGWTIFLRAINTAATDMRIYGVEITYYTTTLNAAVGGS